jgi:uncharacterized YccA/Bax inhibitor family protein
MSQSGSSSQSMTVSGVVNKSIILLLLVMASASYIWGQIQKLGMDVAGGYLLIALIAGVVFGLISAFKPSVAKFTAPLYALCQGVVLGSMSYMLEAQLPGIVIQAVGLTFGTAMAMLGLYRSGMINVTDKFRSIISASVGGICLFYFLTFILGFFGISLPIYSGPIGIGLSLFVVAIASLSLLLDFDSIEKGAQSGAPAELEWYAAFGLMVTLIWLYMEMLRLLSILRSRD